MSRIKSLPFPGESPTVSLAMAAGRMYAPKPEEAKPARSRPRRATKKSAARPARARKPLKKTKARSRAR